MDNHAKGIGPVSVSKLVTDRQDDKGAAPPWSSMSDEALLRVIGVLFLLGVGAMHFLQILTTFEGTPVLGGAYTWSSSPPV